MRQLDTTALRLHIKSLGVNQNFQRRLSLAGIEGMTDKDWEMRELLVIPTKDGGAGVLFVELDDQLYGVSYEISNVRDTATGRSQPIICDFCKTWQAGGRAGSITFRMERRSLNSISFLCCLDLKCSLHVRNMTAAAKSSRVQLREDVSLERRIERLEENLLILVKRLNLKPSSGVTEVMGK